MNVNSVHGGLAEGFSGFPSACVADSCRVVIDRRFLIEEDVTPVTLAAKEGLALTNGTAIMCAIGVLETYRARLMSRVADIASCLSLEALHGTALAFDDRIQQLRPADSV